MADGSAVEEWVNLEEDNYMEEMDDASLKHENVTIDREN